MFHQRRKPQKRRFPSHPEHESLYDIVCAESSSEKRISKASYDLLFHLMNPKRNETTFELLRHRNVSGYRLKIIDAGPIREYEIFPIWNTSAELTKAQEGLSEQSFSDQQTYHNDSRAQQIVNERNARKTLTRRINANFSEEDDFLTYTYAVQPESVEQVEKDARNLIRRLKRVRDKKGLPEMKYIYIIEKGSRKGRLHIHMVMSGGLSRKEIISVWNTEGRRKVKRGRVKPDKMQPDEHQFEGLSRYLSKDPLGKKRWCCSKNLTAPTIRSVDFRLSKRQVEELASDAAIKAPDIFESMRGGRQYRFLDCTVKRSEFVAGAYIYARMRKREDEIETTHIPSQRKPRAENAISVGKTGSGQASRVNAFAPHPQRRQ